MTTHSLTTPRLLPLLVATALPVVLAASPAPASASAAPATCAKGKVPWKLDGRTACAAPARLGTAAGPAAGGVAEAWLVAASRPLPGGRVRLAPALRRAAPRAGRGLQRLVDRATATPAASAAAERGAVTQRIERIVAREQLGNGVVAESRVRGKAFEDGSTELDSEVELRDRHGNAIRYAPRVEGRSAPDTPVGCPTADGAVGMTTSGEVGGTVAVLHGRRVVAAKTDRTVWQVRGRGQVGTDARLQSVTADVRLTTRAFERGASMQLTLDATVSLTRDGAPALTGTPAVDVRLRAAGRTPAQERAAEAEVARVFAADAGMAAAVGKLAGDARRTLLAAERGWYELPNDCAEIAWTPDSRGTLEPGREQEVTASVIARRDGGRASGSIAVARVERGRLTPIASVFSPTAPARFAAVADEPDVDGDTVYAEVVATSTAGRVQRAWRATGSATVRVPQGFRGTVASTSSGGGLTRRFSGSAAFTRRSVVRGPDGSITAWYDLTSASLDRATETHGATEGCRIEAAAAGGRIDAGDLELRMLPGGAVVYALSYDLTAAATFAPTDCAPDHPGVPYDDELSAFLDTRRPGPDEGRLRPAGEGYRLAAAGATDVTGVPHVAGAATTASWDLLPE